MTQETVVKAPVIPTAVRLADAPIFERIPVREMQSVERAMHEVVHDAGDVITAIGAGGIAFFVILEGRVEVQTPDGRHRALGPGDHFGEMALLDQLGRSARVVALTPVRLAGLVGWDFESFLTHHPSVAYRLLKDLSRRLREAEAAH